jgi:hypothetical protein
MSKKKIESKASFEWKIGIYVFLSVLFGILFIWFLVLSFSVTKDEVINYSEKSDIDYKVYLKNNDTYDDEYLEKDNLYIANIIKNIVIDFDYNFLVDKESDIDYTYAIKADLVVYDSKKDKNLLSKEYVLLDETKEKIVNSKDIIVNKEVVIDYDYYNDIVKSFKAKYSIEGDSYLKVYLDVLEDASDSNSYYFYNKNNMSVTIPLSEKVVDIEIKTNDIDKKSRIISDADVQVGKPIYMILCLVFFSLMVFFINLLCKKLGLAIYKQNKYDKLVKKIIRNNDSIIIDTPTPPNKSLKIIRVDNFDELKDAHDMVQEPIMFYEISKHNKCEFYITHGNNLYLYKVRLLDLEGNNKK